jgi:hypothetical protein
MNTNNLTIPKNNSSIKVCVCTSYRADREPRAPRHAAAIAQLGSEFQVTFVESASMGQPPSSLKDLESLPNLRLITYFFPHRKSGFIALLINRVRKKIAQVIFRFFGILLSEAFSTNVIGLEKVLNAVQADIYLAHNTQVLNVKKEVIKIAQNMVNSGRRIKKNN